MLYSLFREKRTLTHSFKVSWGYMIAITKFTASIGKFGSCTVVAHFFVCSNWRESSTIGFLISCKGYFHDSSVDTICSLVKKAAPCYFESPQLLDRRVLHGYPRSPCFNFYDNSLVTWLSARIGVNQLLGSSTMLPTKLLPQIKRRRSKITNR
jgi:hypothetical protein